MTGSQLFERVEITLTTGQWWAIPWWRTNQYYDDGFITKDNVEAAFAQLKAIFDAEWVIEERDFAITEARVWLKEHEQEVSQKAQLLDLKKALDKSSGPSEAYKICQLIGFRVAHPLFNEFLTEGSLPFQYLANLGLNLLSAKEANLLKEDLIGRLTVF